MRISVELIKTYSPELPNVINRLLKELDGSATFLKKNDIEDMISSPANRIFVARDNKEIVGMITLVIFRIPFAKKGLLEDFVVEEKYRGEGIGTKLLKAAISRARKEKVKYIDFTSNPKRLAANKLYQHLGFEKRNTNIYRVKI